MWATSQEILRGLYSSERGFETARGGNDKIATLKNGGDRRSENFSAQICALNGQGTISGQRVAARYGEEQGSARHRQ
jgi:hypothetical protein